MQSHQTVSTILRIAYSSLFLQTVASVATFALTRRKDRNRELLWVAMLAALQSVVISGFAPALGPMAGGTLLQATIALLKVRDGTMKSVAPDEGVGNCSVPLISCGTCPNLHLRASSAVQNVHSVCRAQCSGAVGDPFCGPPLWDRYDRRSSDYRDSDRIVSHRGLNGSRAKSLRRQGSTSFCDWPRRTSITFRGVDPQPVERTQPTHVRENQRVSVGVFHRFCLCGVRTIRAGKLSRTFLAMLFPHDPVVQFVDRARPSAVGISLLHNPPS